jgi:TrpR-related protein YerC/YecD
MKNALPYPTEEMRDLFKAILSLKNTNEASNFFRDLLTIAELKEFANRFKIAKLLFENKYSYSEIAKKCSVSTTTVTRVAHWLHHGMGGYSSLLTRLKKSK